MPKGSLIVIEGFDGLNEIYRREIPSGAVTSAKLEELLRCLVAKHALSDDEIVSAFQKGRTKGSRKELLQVTYDRTKPLAMCGDSIHFTARYISAPKTARPSPE